MGADISEQDRSFLMCWLFAYSVGKEKIEAEEYNEELKHKRIACAGRHAKQTDAATDYRHSHYQQNYLSCRQAS